ncbi:hypothetical protein CDQ84_17045 [Clostridium thermosuccinogenes]|uniref:Uncharacterized protein n=1 Tax=Clostridium thermosuccinogenes TaxID=84032 RepID=A0A2K2F7T7_9CLOT|nr:hypothetical protein [Pseudoclostridium thermosuccinogenes]AUS98294.1 hypothetical protein CDO33_18630 [Pseudoclostridium thermosuccinogenes]PNT91059.1 hypothetical protein CDQ83_14660 [Pseudoclostridium thermosuccinogenes]PNT94828.1 hypothetical protein CDQ85_16945 [Pseudoclostridium thermosuccinogenes]PNT95471.1 hypothetical protein CDQ84_17045 [Pseudoclostridium thermosuccinogenes]
MKLVGKIIKETKIIKHATVEKVDHKMSYTDLLEDCLVNLCSKLDIQVPLWLDKNTREFVNFRKTIFTNEQFMDSVNFDRFEIKAE